MFTDYIPEAPGIGPGGDAFKHERSTAGAEGTIHDVGVTGDPAYVGCAEVDVIGLYLEDIDEGVCGPYHIACAGVHYAFWLARGAGSIKDEKRVFSIHLLGRERRTIDFLYLINFISPPGIAPMQHAHRGMCAPKHNHALYEWTLYE